MIVVFGCVIWIFASLRAGGVVFGCDCGGWVFG